MDHLRAPGHFPSRQSVELIFCTQTLFIRIQRGFRYRHNRQGRLTMNSKQVVLITGSSTGFGRLFAETLARKGHTVFATMRDPGGRNAKNASEIRTLAEKESLPIHVLELDVTEDRKSTRLNSSHSQISYAVFCLKKKKQNSITLTH